MKRTISSLLLVFAASISNAQIVNDDLNWVSATPVSSATSPDFDFCNGSTVSYQITSGTHQFMNVSGAPNGFIIPANTLADASTAIPVNIAFSSEVCNLRIHFVDIDGLQNESVTSISPAYSSLTGPFFDPGTSMDAVDATTDNAAGWVIWTGSLTNVTFTHTRPGTGFGLIVDSIYFECCNPCPCRHEVELTAINDVNQEGFASSEITINTMGAAVRSICIDLPFYRSNVNDNCLKCDPGNTEQYGTILGAGTISGVNGIIHDPYNLGYSRKICWNFPVPTVVNTTVQIDLKFPAVLELSCCKNSVSYCYDVKFVNEDCTSCEFELCTKFPQTNTPTGENSIHQGGSGATISQYNDFVANNGFLLTPNPSDGKVEVQIQDETLIGGKLVVSTSAGKEVLTVPVNKTTETFHVSAFSKGTYVVSIENNGHASSTMLIVK